MSTAIFIKSYPGDYEWLGFCLKSIAKFAKGFSEVVVALPEGETFTVLPGQRVVGVKEKGNGYYWQMVVKMYADAFTKADHILYIDSDCVLTKPFDAAEMFRDGRPMLLRRRWEEAGEGICWKPIAEAMLGRTCEFDTMACHPSIYRRESLIALRAHIKQVHGVDLKRLPTQLPKLIEFVSVGNFILQDHPNEYAVIDYGSGDGYPRPIKQSWSWGGMTPELRAELQAITE